jgi:hypothetical protein
VSQFSQAGTGQAQIHSRQHSLGIKEELTIAWGEVVAFLQIKQLGTISSHARHGDSPSIGFASVSFLYQLRFFADGQGFSQILLVVKNRRPRKSPGYTVAIG